MSSQLGIFATEYAGIKTEESDGEVGLQCVAVCCSVLQYVAVYCSVLQCVFANTYAGFETEESDGEVGL